jgi:prepilin-type N-terminal cleavage/methylation domain-containing protein
MKHFKPKQTQTGFSLVEMAIVLAIVALLLGGLLPTISSQIEQQRRNETRKQLEEIKESLYGFAISRGYLPCPASQLTGVEDRNGATQQCNVRLGYLPWVTLGSNRSDGWGRLFRYSVTYAFSNASAVFSTSTPRDITIDNLDGTNLSSPNDIPAVVISHGANGIFGTLETGTYISSAAPVAYANVANQLTNVSGVAGAGPIGTTFFSGDPRARTANDDENFDDLVVWISPNILFNRMISAGKLP